MMVICILCAATVLWQADFNDGLGNFSQLYDYEVKMVHKEGKVILTANPRFEGFASAWLYVDEEVTFTRDDLLELKIKVDDNKVRFRYFYLAEEGRVYYAGEEYISRSRNWQNIMIPLVCARPFYSSNFPWSLTPDKKPPLFIFIENALPGSFEVEIDRISVKRVIEREEQ